jgi:hypothetical protein
MTSYLNTDCSGCSYDFSYNVVGCKTCHGISGESLINYYSFITQKRIQNQVRAPASLYTMNLAALNVRGDKNNAPKTTSGFYNVNWNQSSDRNRAANSDLPTNVKIRYVPTRGNSTKHSLTRARPGASAPGGQGVDVKHNSYDRYLARLKSNNIRTQQPTSLTPKYGNKTRMVGMIDTSSCHCGEV